jgi:DUF1365 family protein
MDMIYHWRFNDPDNTLHMHIENHQEAKVFDATLALRRELTRPALRAAAAHSADDPENRFRHLLAGAEAVAQARAAV